MATRPAAIPPPPQPDPSASLRAQLLATEHWSLLATRGMTQSEMLVRISMFLTLVSASVVSLALVGQLTAFGGIFSTFAIILLTIVVTLGTLTSIRVYNAAMEDLAYVLGMNRLRAAYVELDAGASRFLATSPHDDEKGSVATYSPLGGGSWYHVFGSSMMFVTSVTGGLAGVLAGVIVSATGAVEVVVYILGAAVFVAYIAMSMALGGRRYFAVWGSWVPVSRSPGE
jgi:hypothetical protein